MTAMHLAKIASIQRSVRRADLDVAIIASVITRDLDDLLTFTERVARLV